MVMIFLTDRARVTKGLPDVVAIMEDKVMCVVLGWVVYVSLTLAVFLAVVSVFDVFH